MPARFFEGAVCCNHEFQEGLACAAAREEARGSRQPEGRRWRRGRPSGGRLGGRAGYGLGVAPGFPGMRNLIAYAQYCMFTEAEKTEKIELGMEQFQSGAGYVVGDVICYRKIDWILTSYRDMFFCLCLQCLVDLPRPSLVCPQRWFLDD